MICTTLIEQYTEAVEGLIKSKPGVYKNFDNVAKLLLTSEGLSTEDKMLALAHTSKIYQGLSLLDPTFYKLGNAQNIIDAEHLSEDAIEYVNHATNLLYDTSEDVPSVEAITEKSINDMIKDAAEDVASISMTEVNEILDKVDDFLNANEFDTVDNKVLFMDSIRENLLNAISLNGIGKSKQSLIRRVNEKLIDTTAKTNYIDIYELKDLNRDDQFLITLNNGAFVEAILEDGKYFIYDSRTGSQTEHIPSNEIYAVKSIRKRNEFKGLPNGEFSIPADSILTGFQLEAIDENDEVGLRKVLSKLSGTAGAIRVTAVRLSDVGDARVNSIHNNAKEDNTKSSLLNRKFETFENASQREILKNDKNAKVVSMRRPTRDNDSIAFIGSIKGTNYKFYMYNLDNFTIVDSNNNTIPLDFSNKDHIEIVKEQGLKLNGNSFSKLSEEDIVSLSKAYTAFQEFKANIDHDMMMGNEESMDVTEKFEELYGFSDNRQPAKETVLLNAMENDPSLSTSVTVVTYDAFDPTKIIETNENFLLPVNYTKSYDHKTKQFKYKIQPILLKEQRIVITNSEGKSREVSERYYIENILLGNKSKSISVAFDEMFAFENAKYSKSKSQEHLTSNFVVKFNTDGTIGYVPSKFIDPLYHGENFMEFVHSYALLDIYNEKQVLAFDKARGFNYYDSKRKAKDKTTPPLVVNFKAVGRKKDGAVHASIKLDAGFTSNSDFARYFKGDKEWNYTIPATWFQGLIIDKLSAMHADNGIINKVLSEYDTLEYDKSSSASVNEFFSNVYRLAQSPTATDNLKELVETVESFSNELTTELTNKMVSMIKENFQKEIDVESAEGKTTLIDTLKKHYNYKRDGNSLDDYYFERLIVESHDNKDFLGTHAVNKNAYYNTMKNLATITEAKDTIVVPKGKVVSEVPSAVEAIDGEAFDNAEANEEIQDAKERIAQGVAALDKNPDTKDDPKPIKKGKNKRAKRIKKKPNLDDSGVRLSVEHNGIDVATEDDVQSESEWLAENLPQFQLKESHLGDIIDMTKINGTVLGLYKDKVIHLNKSLTGKGTVYHEAFHGVFRNIATADVRDSLIDSVKGYRKHKSQFSDKALMQFAKDRGLVYDKTEISRIVAEEILADGFKEYMLNKSKPQGALAMLFEMLKNLIALFTKRSNYIDTIYSNIRTGYYRTAELNSGLYEGQHALEAIPGLVKHYIDGDVNYSMDSTLSSREQAMLINMVVGRIVEEDNTGKSFDEKFELVTKELVSVYDIDRIIDEAEDKGIDVDVDAVIAKYGPMLSQFRFMLGARMLAGDENITYDINHTGLEEHDTKYAKNEVDTGTTVVENRMGEFSKETLKKLVAQRYNAITSIEFDEELQEKNEELEQILSEDPTKNSDELDEIDDEVSSDYDSAYGQEDVNSQVKYIRKFLSTIERSEVDEELGVEIPRVVDGAYIFNTLLKTTAGKDPSDIIPHLKLIADQMREDGNITTADDIKAIYERIESDTLIDNSTGLPTRNLHLYNKFIEVLNVTEIDYTMFTLLTPQNIPGRETMDQKSKVFIQDSVINTDILTIKDDLISSMQSTYKNKNIKKAASHKKGALNLRSGITTIVESSSNDPMVMTGSETAMSELNNMAEELHGNMKAVGVSVPKSLVKLSLLAIDVNENEQGLPKDEELLTLYNTHKEFIQEGQYLEKDFFRDLSALTYRMYDVDGNKLAGFAEYMEEDKKKMDKTKGRFLKIFRKASHYIIKYDPKHVVSVIKNAEGKNIYRYAKYNPLVQLTQRIRREGLRSTLASDPYAEKFLLPFIEDNHLLGVLLDDENKGSKKYNEALLFLDNLNVSMLGGIKQVIGDTVKAGKTFKTIDSKSLYALHIMSFLNRTTRSKGQNSITTFKRQFHQLESTNTNFLVDGMYKQFVGKTNRLFSLKSNSGVATYGKSLAIVEDFEAIIKQEYNRISREFASREEKLNNFKSSIKNELILDYNAEYDVDGEVVSHDNLRAYKFNKLQSFWGQPESKVISEIKEVLIRNAKDGVEFNNISEEQFDIKSLHDELDSYAKSEFNNHIDQLVANGVLIKHSTDVSKDIANRIYLDVSKKYTPEQAESFREKLATDTTNAKNNVNIPMAFRNIQPTLEISTPDDQGLVSVSINPNAVDEVWYTSPIIPNEVITDYQSPSTILEHYPKLGNVANDSGMYAMAFDAFMNHWANSLHVNQVFDGDVAMGVKNDVDLVKRYKKYAAAGSNMKQGTHRVATINTIRAYSHNKHVGYGPYTSADEIVNDFHIKDENIRTEILVDFTEDSRKENRLDRAYKAKGKLWEIFDGQSISSLMHQMDMHSSLGRLNDRATQLLIKKHYAKLTHDEIKELQKIRIVNNSKKTVTAGRNTYFKLSEYYIDRLDVSYFDFEKSPNETAELYETRKQARLDQIHLLYSQIYEARLQPKTDVLNKQIKAWVTDIHSSFKPKKNRKQLHDLLNSMEYQQIDQLIDTEASKNTTLFPVDIFTADRTAEGHYNLDISTLEVENQLKYLQVETSGVKDKAKVGVQKKILIPADVQSLISDLRSKGDLSAKDSLELDRLQKSLDDYNKSLADGAKSRFEYVKNVFRQGGDLDVGGMYDLIRDGLESQGAKDATIKLFNTENGKPVINPNMSVVRRVVEYFFFSHYSNHITDEKASGFKSFLESAWGWDVLVDTTTDEVITNSKYDLDPAFYEDPKYRSRPLSFTTEYDESIGITTYFTECIVPKPNFRNKAEEEFFMENLNKMFATRIPTEDKRSMIALKVVDFVDESKLNAILVPQYIHILSGSDFDIDSLFGQTLATYYDALGSKRIYGEYTDREGNQLYGTKENAEFVEYMHYLAKKPEFKNKVAERKAEIMENGELVLGSENFKHGATITELLSKIYNWAPEDVRSAFSFTAEEELEVRSKIKSISEKISDKKEARLPLKEELDSLLKPDPTQEERAAHKSLSEKVAEISSSIHENIELRKDLRGDLKDFRKIRTAATTYKAILDVLAKAGLPVTVESFISSEAGILIGTKHQNSNLNATIDLLSNEKIFENLYINQKSSDQMFIDILSKFGLTVEMLTAIGDIHTIDSVVASKIQNYMNKDGISIAASLNKFLGLASTYQLQLNPKDSIWSFSSTNDKGKLEYKQRSTFDNKNDNDQRAIEVIGAILGVFADGAKKPIPAALGLNEVNANAALVMTSLGLDPNFVMGFNYIPEVRNAVKKVQEVNYAITEDLSSEVIYFNNAINDEVKQLTDDPTVFKEILDAGLVDESEGTHASYFFNLDNSDLVIDFKPQRLDANDVQANILNTIDIGYTVTNKKGVSLSPTAQKVVLLKMYSNQVSQLFNIRKASAPASFHKKLKPDTIAFDRTMEHIDYLTSEESIFRPEGIDKMLYEGDSVYSVAWDVYEDADEQLNKLFLERNKVFGDLPEIFAGVLEDKRLFSDVLAGSIAITTFRQNMLNRQGATDIEKDFIEADNANLAEVFDPNYLFNNRLYSEIEEVAEANPDNQFLSKLRKEVNENISAKVNIKEVPTLVKEHTVRLMSKAQLSGEVLEAVEDDIVNLYNSGRDNRLFIRKLMYNELARTGLQYKEGSFLSLFPEPMMRELSKGLSTVVSLLTDANKVRKTGVSEYTVNDVSFATQKEADSYLSNNSIDVLGEISKVLGMDFNSTMDNVIDQLSVATSAVKPNKKIKSAQPLKMGVTKELMYNSGLAHAVRFDTGFEGEALNNEIYNVVESAFSIEFTARNKFNTKRAPFKLDSSAESFNINTPGEMRTAKAVAKIFSLKTTTIDSGKTPYYVFPAVVKVGNEYFRLKSTSNGNFELNTILNNILNDKPQFDIATSGSYVKINDKLALTIGSNISMSAMETKEYEALTNGDKVAPLKETLAKPEIVKKSPEESTAPEVVEKQIRYTPKGQSTKTFTIRGEQIFNSKGVEVYSKEGTHRTKIFANLAVKEGRAIIVEHADSQYVVNNKNEITSVTTGKIMQWADNNGNRVAIIDLANEKRKLIAKGNPSNLQSPKLEDIKKCKS